MSGNGVLCVVRDTPSAFSETFITAQERGLPYKIITLYGQTAERLDRGAERVSVWKKSVIALRRNIFWRSPQDESRFFYTKALREIQPDAVLAQFGPLGVRVMAACEDLNIPLITYFRGKDASAQPILDVYRVAYSTLFGSTSAIIAKSEQIRDRLLELGASERKIIVDYGGVDVERFHGGSPAGAGPLFIAVGRLTEKKAPHLTLLAFRKTLERVPAAELVLVGDGPLRGVVRDMVRGLGLVDKVRLTGEAPHDEVRRLMREARAFVQHSVQAIDGDIEGVPNSVMEASAVGIPVVATRHSGIPACVRHGETGFLVDEHDVDGMAAFMTELALDPDLAGRMGQAGRARMVAEFSIDKSLQVVSEVIQRAVLDAGTTRA